MGAFPNHWMEVNRDRNRHGPLSHRSRPFADGGNRQLRGIRIALGLSGRPNTQGAFPACNIIHVSLKVLRARQVVRVVVEVPPAILNKFGHLASYQFAEDACGCDAVTFCHTTAKVITINSVRSLPSATLSRRTSCGRTARHRVHES